MLQANVVHTRIHFQEDVAVMHLLSRKHMEVSVSQLELACARGDAQLVSNLLEQGVSPNQECLYRAVLADRREIIRLLLLDNRVDPSGDDNYALKMCARRCDLETCRLLLLNKRVDPTSLAGEDLCKGFYELVAAR